MNPIREFEKFVRLSTTALLVISFLAACNVGESVVITNNGEETDADFNVGEPDAGEPDGGEPDADVEEPDPEELPAEAREWCSAGGVATGQGIRLIHCTAPASISGPTLEGDGIRLETGASHVILH